MIKTGSELAAGIQLILFVTGDAPRSRRARSNLQDALETLATGTRSEEIDLIENPEPSLRYGIFATPALLATADGEAHRVLYGDLSERDLLQQFLTDAFGTTGTQT